MVEPRARTASLSVVSQAAEAALLDPDGITIWFKLTDYFSLAECALQARSFQQSFSSLRARVRRQKERDIGDSRTAPPRDTYARGIYDRLVCQRHAMPDDLGWYVTLLPENIALDALVITSNSTGLPLEDIGRGKSELSILSHKFAESTRTFSTPGPPCTREELERLIELAPELEEQLRPIIRGERVVGRAQDWREIDPSERQPSERPKGATYTLGDTEVTFEAQEDIANVSLEDMFGKPPKGG